MGVTCGNIGSSGELVFGCADGGRGGGCNDKGSSDKG